MSGEEAERASSSAPPAFPVPGRKMEGVSDNERTWVAEKEKEKTGAAREMRRNGADGKRKAGARWLSSSGRENEEKRRERRGAGAKRTAGGEMRVERGRTRRVQSASLKRFRVTAQRDKSETKRG